MFVDAAISIPIFVISMYMVISLVFRAGKEADAVLKMLKKQEASNIAMAISGIFVETPMVFFDEGHKLFFRPFCGEGKDEGSERVYVFPKHGERYHYLGCSTLRNGDIVMVLSKVLRRRYSPCRICHPDNLPNGATVCIYGESSTVYHRNSCACISKNYECVTKEDAISRGYTECRLCSPTSGTDYGF